MSVPAMLSEVRRLRARLEAHAVAGIATAEESRAAWSTAIYDHPGMTAEELILDVALALAGPREGFSVRPIAVTADSLPPVIVVGLVTPWADLRFVAADDPIRRLPLCAVATGLYELGEPLLIDGERCPESWGECYWLAATAGDGLYLADSGDEAVAVRSEAGRVEERCFGEGWQSIGSVDPGRD
jgi:hypothetical protein